LVTGTSGGATPIASSLQVTGTLFVGSLGHGTLTVSNGGQVTSSSGVAGVIGYLGGASGTVVLTGAGSS
jgi:T5SS/PEP-CTERM-associated repeat protein